MDDVGLSLPETDYLEAPWLPACAKCDRIFPPDSELGVWIVVQHPLSRMQDPDPLHCQCAFNTELDRKAATWWPTFVVPVRAMWQTLQTFHIANFADVDMRGDHFTRVDPAGRTYVPILHRSTRVPAEAFATDTIPRRAAWFYTTDALFCQLNEAIQRDAIPQKYVLYTHALLKAFEHGLDRRCVLHRSFDELKDTVLATCHVPQKQRLVRFVPSSRNPLAAGEGRFKLEFECPAQCSGVLCLRGISECYKMDQVLLAPYTVWHCLTNKRTPAGGALRFRLGGTSADWALRHEAMGGALFIQGRAVANPDTLRVNPWRVRSTDVRQGLEAFTDLIRAARTGGAGSPLLSTAQDLARATHSIFRNSSPTGSTAGSVAGSRRGSRLRVAWLPGPDDYMTTDALDPLREACDMVSSSTEVLRGMWLSAWDLALTSQDGDPYLAAARFWCLDEGSLGTQHYEWLQTPRTAPSSLLNRLLLELADLEAPQGIRNAAVLTPLLPYFEALRIYTATHPYTANMVPAHGAAPCPLVPSSNSDGQVTCLFSMSPKRFRDIPSTGGLSATFTCCTTNLSISQLGQEGTLFVIVCPPQAAGISSIKGLSTAPEEHEVLIFPGWSISSMAQISKEDFCQLTFSAIPSLDDHYELLDDQLLDVVRVDFTTDITHDSMWSSPG